MLARQDTEDRNMSKNDFLYELEKETLHELRYYLCNHLQPEKLYPWLQSKKVLTTDHTEILASEKTTNSKVNRLVDFVIKSGPGCLEVFKRAIRKSNKTQLFIADKLGAKFNEVQNREQNKVRLQFITVNPSPPPYSESCNSFFLPDFNSQSSRPKETCNLSYPRRPPVSNEWPTGNTSKICASRLNSENEIALWDRSYFASKDFRTLSSPETSAPDMELNSTQSGTQLNRPTQLQPSTSGQNRERVDSEYRGSGSSVTMRNIELEQQLEYEKLQAKIQSERASMSSIRQPGEHDMGDSARFVSNSDSTEVKQLATTLTDSHNILYPPSQDFQSFEISVDDLDSV